MMYVHRYIVNKGMNFTPVRLNIEPWACSQTTSFSTTVCQCIRNCFPTQILPVVRRSKIFEKMPGKTNFCAQAPTYSSEKIESPDNHHTLNYAKNLKNVSNNVNNYTTRTHTCGELRLTDVGKKVILCGWIEFNRLNKFILLRDAYGTTQVIVKDDEKLKPVLDNLHLEACLCVTGIIFARPKSQINKNLSTGEIEVHAESIQILNNATENLPFHIRDFNKANDKVLNRYRYLALRFSQFQHNLRLRSEMFFKMREFLIRSRGFTEVETPTLFKKTPGGAQEFIVPTHIKNKFYSLVQSPQQLKQLLMVGSIDRYFQIARCYRDERTNTERQPEFTQLDVELSFTNTEAIMKLTEEVLAASWPRSKDPLQIPFPVMQYKDAIENYGSDKPCLTDKFCFQNLEKYISVGDSKHVYMYVIPDGLAHHSKMASQFANLTAESDVSVYAIKVPTLEKFYQSLSKIVPGFNISSFQTSNSVNNNDLVVLAKGSKKLKTLKILGLCRHQTIDHFELIQQLNENGIYQFFWIVNFPLVELNDSGEIVSTHHPFTRPHPDDIELMQNDIFKVRSLAYDLVLNGSEIGGGSIRIHDANMQRNILKLLNLEEYHFSHLLEALQMGCPPHGGIALGLDRLVAILCGCSSIKDVIAFPKGTDGQDFMTKCPSDIPIEDKIRYHLLATCETTATKSS